MRALLVIGSFLLFAAWLGYLDADEFANDGTDTGVGCIEDCLEPSPPQPEPVPTGRPDYETPLQV